MANAPQQDIGRLEGKIDGIVTDLAHIKKQLDGNGRPGLVERTVSLEEFMEAHCEAQESMVSGLIAQFTESQTKLEKNQKEVSDKLGALKTSVDSHHADKAQHSLWGQLTWKAAGIFVFVVAIITLIIPQELSVWDLVMKLLGTK